MDIISDAVRAPCRVGVWAPLQLWTNERAALGEVGAELDALGYTAIWIGNGPGMFDVVEALLEATRRITVATGIANIKAHPVEATAARFTEIAARHQGRVLLGLGGGWGPVDRGEGPPRGTWRERMADYLDVLDGWSPPIPRTSRVLAANGPQMLRLSRERSAGAHSFLVTPEHTRWAREVLGEGPLLAPEQKVVLETDPAKARAIARRNLGFYLGKPNYASVLRRLGFAEQDFGGGGSDRLVDALVAWGDVEAIGERIDQHLDAGADHVALQVLTDDTDASAREPRLPRALYRSVAEVITAR